MVKRKQFEKTCTNPLPALSGFGKFFLPGPTEVRSEILQAMTRPVIGHRGADIEALVERMEPGLRKLFRTERPVYVSTSSATGLMEAAIRNCVQDRVLCFVCGGFSERFYKIAVACSKHAERVDVEWGEANEPGQVADAVSRAEYDAITVVHSETSTGVLNPVREIAAAVRETSPETLVLVDCVSSLGAAPLEFDGWGLDFALTGSQKALALPPGLALGAASQRAYDRSLGLPNRGLYFSFEAFERSAAARQSANTPAVSLFFALEEQLERIEREGLENRWARHQAMAERTWGWAQEVRDRHAIDLHVLAAEGRRSPAVTCVVLPEGLDGVDVTKRAAEEGFTIAPGYGILSQSSFRIGHMGDHSVEELDALLGVLESVVIRGG